MHFKILRILPVPAIILHVWGLYQKDRKGGLVSVLNSISALPFKNQQEYLWKRVSQEE